MTQITKRDVIEASELKEKIEEALEELKLIARKAGGSTESRFNAYVVGHIESALDDITGMGNSSVQDFIETLEDLIVEEDLENEIEEDFSTDDILDNADLGQCDEEPIY